MVYKRNRYYDPTQGRFTQIDQIGLGGGLNAYGFAGGDPINYSDPFGLCKQGDPCPPEDDVLQRGVNAAYSRTGSEGVLDVAAGAYTAFSILGDGIEGAGPSGELKAASGIVYRFGKDIETVESLANDAADAEKAGVGHGVSVTTRKPTRTAASSAERDVVDQNFPLKQTGGDKAHHTAALPKPVTQAVADLWNKVFGRTSQ